MNCPSVESLGERVDLLRDCDSRLRDRVFHKLSLFTAEEQDGILFDIRGEMSDNLTHNATAVDWITIPNRFERSELMILWSQFYRFEFHQKFL